ncbi:hypothetical protein [Thermococcus gammatolerans]|uniref:hypothetical protein n=1 Tax=Thermococcus gammatolerans TaxID=187878 RepID=UPI0011D14D0A|nr:hypothetical protein [Thermococcus gammatolerans]
MTSMGTPHLRRSSLSRGRVFNNPLNSCHEITSSTKVNTTRKTAPTVIPIPNRLKRWKTIAKIEIPTAGAIESLTASEELGKARFTRGRPSSQTKTTAQQGQRERDRITREITKRELIANGLRKALSNTLGMNMAYD